MRIWPFYNGKFNTLEQHVDLEVWGDDIYLVLVYLAGLEGKTVDELLQDDVKRIAAHCRSGREDIRECIAD